MLKTTQNKITLPALDSFKRLFETWVMVPSDRRAPRNRKVTKFSNACLKLAIPSGQTWTERFVAPSDDFCQCRFYGLVPNGLL